MTAASFFISVFHDQIAWSLDKVRYAEEEFLGPDDDWVEDDRRVLFEAVNPIMARFGRPTVQKVGAAGHIVTLEAPPDEIEEQLEPTYQRNLLSTRKYRVLSESGRQYAVGSLVYDPSDKGWQHHVYLFPGPGGRTEIYGHHEPSVRDPDAHHKGIGAVHGDPKNILKREL